VKTKIHKGKVSIVTGAASGIGQAIALKLHEEGATVIGIDINPAIQESIKGNGLYGWICDLSDDRQIKHMVEKVVARFGSLDILVSNAGIFIAGQTIEDLDNETWDKTILINLTSHQRLLKFSIPYLKKGSEATAIFIGSRNVQAPGAGAAAYSVSKAGLTQLVRVAALELAQFGIRVNVIHPDAVFDTSLWTPEVLKRSADRYGMTVDQYKTKNLLNTEIKSADVANAVSVFASSLFSKTTGAQIPVDGGNDRVI